MYQVQVRYPEPNQTRRQGWHDVVEVGLYSTPEESTQFANTLQVGMKGEAEYRVVSRKHQCAHCDNDAVTLVTTNGEVEALCQVHLP